MTTASFTSAMGGRDPGGRPGTPAKGATALDDGHPHPRHLLGNALRVAKVFVSTAFGVVVLGQSDEDAGVYRRAPRR